MRYNVKNFEQTFFQERTEQLCYRTTQHITEELAHNNTCSQS